MDNVETGNIGCKTLDENKPQRKPKMQSRMYHTLTQTNEHKTLDENKRQRKWAIEKLATLSTQDTGQRQTKP